MKKELKFYLNKVPELKLRIIPTLEGYYDALLDKYIYNFTDHLGNVRLSYSDSNKDGIIAPAGASVSLVSINKNKTPLQRQWCLLFHHQKPLYLPV
ncbi:hypothetical protein [uncultured Chryseobacterium sp.]|uniref:hypothetical protein n=1 Tax=uncultured Chryseobacterium sp. TaxID=259322 RepID=UPI002586F031|nr:hypothetical protein [uncultured Chryseobacterium sp.]